MNGVRSRAPARRAVPTGTEPGLWPVVRPAFLCYLAVRVVMLVETLVWAHVRHAGVETLLTRWDARYYALVATNGYPAEVDLHRFSTIPFFPLYPLAGRALHFLTGLPVAWVLVVIGWVSGLVMLPLAAALVRDLWGAERARRAVLLLAVFPGAVILCLTYADGMATMLAVGCLLALQRRRFVLAGILGAVAGAAFSLATPSLLIAVVVFALAAREARAVITAAIVPAGAAAYFGYLWSHTGSPLTWLRVERDAWHNHLSLPTTPGTNFHDYGFVHPEVGTVTALTIVVGVLALVALVARRAPPHWIAFVVLDLAAGTFDGGNHLTPRLVFDAFPAVLALGACVPRRLLPVIVTLSIACLGALFLAYTPRSGLFLAP